MKFLNTKETGFDYYSIGFPSVETCQAIVYQTKFGLFGYHDSLGTDAGFTQKCVAFAQFVQNHSINHDSLAVCLVGAITRYTRFAKGDDQGQKAQLLEVAQKLNFTGSVYGVRLVDHVKEGDSAYIRFDIANGKVPPVQISYKTWGKMDYDKSQTLKPSESEFGMLQPLQLKKFLTQEQVNKMAKENTLQQAYDNAPFEMVMPPLASYPVHRRGQTGEGKLHIATNLVKFR